MKENLTIPNIISLVRICMIPVFIYLYFSTGTPNHLWWSLFVIILSAVSDIVDGFIARQFNMCSDVGKILDPIADKLTQVTVVFCLVSSFPKVLIPMVCVLFTKELMTLFVAVNVLKNGFKPISSKWFGKLSTVVVYLTFFYAIYMKINDAMPIIGLKILTALSTICLLISMAGYIKIVIQTDTSDNKGVNKK